MMDMVMLCNALMSLLAWTFFFRKALLSRRVSKTWLTLLSTFHLAEICMPKFGSNFWMDDYIFYTFKVLNIFSIAQQFFKTAYNEENSTWKSFTHLKSLLSILITKKFIEKIPSHSFTWCLNNHVQVNCSLTRQLIVDWI